MSKRPRSEIWDHMEKVREDCVQCKLCNKEFSYSGSTSTLSRHLHVIHANIVPADPAPSTSSMKKAASVTQPTLVFGSRKFSEARQEKATTLLTKFIVSNVLPLSLVDDEAFMEFVNFLEPGFHVPCRQTLTARLDGMKTELAEKVKTEMVEVKSVAVTTDIWTSISNEPYISFTASYVTLDWQLVSKTLCNEPMEERHTQANIAARLKDMATSWSIQDKIIAVIHDGAANMKETGKDNGWNDIGCANHKLHLAVTGCLGIDKVTNNPISKCISAASRLVTHFAHSPRAAIELEARQEAMGVKGDDGKPLKLLQHVKTRWNSVYDMMERLVKLRWPVVAILSDRSFVKATDAKTLDMRDEHWQLMEYLLPVLQPLQIVTSLLSAKISPSSSTVYLMLMKLRTGSLAVTAIDSPAVHAFKDDLRKALTEHFALDDPTTAMHPFVVASVLDPATRCLDNFGPQFRAAAYDNVRELTAASSQQPPAAAVTETVEPPAEKKVKLDNRSATLAFLGVRGASASPEVSEFDRYLSTPVGADVDALSWWKDNKASFPQVAAVAACYLAIPATSVMSERQFSAAGRLITKLRSRLDPQRVDTMMFLYKNM